MTATPGTRVGSRHLEHVAGEIEPHDDRAASRHRLGEQTTAATDVQHLTTVKRAVALDVASRTGFRSCSGRISPWEPTSDGDRFEARDLRRVDVAQVMFRMAARSIASEIWLGAISGKLAPS